jgi:hypothetical protein
VKGTGTERWLAETAAAFWRAAGPPPPFPRDLQTPVTWALPLLVQPLPGLRVDGVRAWLEQAAIPVGVPGPDRPLHACLVACRGRGAVLLDAEDPENQRRFSLAHEVAHFLVDYLAPRRRVLHRLGPEAAEVLDGHRPPTLDEQVGALLTGITLGVHTHLLHRSHDGSIGCGQVIAAESRADRLALELLAPAAAVRIVLERRGPLRQGRGRPDEQADETAGLLMETFGLPATAAAPYGRWLCHHWYREPSVQEWLGI